MSIVHIFSPAEMVAGLRNSDVLCDSDVNDAVSIYASGLIFLSMI